MSVKKAEKLWTKRELDDLISLEITEKGMSYYIGLGLCALDRKKEAILLWSKESCDKCVRALAYEAYDLGDFTNSIKFFTKLIRAKLATTDDIVTLAEIFMRQEKLANAEKLLKKVSKTDNELVFLNLAIIFALKKDQKNVLENLKRITKLNISDLNFDLRFSFLWENKEFQEITK